MLVGQNTQFYKDLSFSYDNLWIQENSLKISEVFLTDHSKLYLKCIWNDKDWENDEKLEEPLGGLTTGWAEDRSSHWAGLSGLWRQGKEGILW